MAVKSKVKVSTIFRDSRYSTFHLEQFFFFFGNLFRIAPMAYGGSQARGLIGAAAAGLHHSHSNAGSEPRLPPTPQLTAMLDP